MVGMYIHAKLEVCVDARILLQVVILGPSVSKDETTSEMFKVFLN